MFVLLQKICDVCGWNCRNRSCNLAKSRAGCLVLHLHLHHSDASSAQDCHDLNLGISDLDSHGFACVYLQYLTFPDPVWKALCRCECFECPDQVRENDKLLIVFCCRTSCLRQFIHRWTPSTMGCIRLTRLDPSLLKGLIMHPLLVKHSKAN